MFGKLFESLPVSGSKEVDRNNRNHDAEIFQLTWSVHSDNSVV